MTWVLEDAPDVPAHLVGTLMALANHADRAGRGAYPSQDLIAHYTRKSDRQVRRDLVEMSALGLIRLGDQRLVAHIPSDERPVVYDLAVERKRPARDRTCTSAPKSKGTGRARPLETDEGPDVHVRADADVRADVHVQRDRTSTSKGTGRPRPTNRPSNRKENQEPFAELTLVDVEGSTDEKPPAPAAEVVAAYIESYEKAHQERPSSRYIGQVGRDAKQLLDTDKRPLDRVVLAATQLGQTNFSDLVREYGKGPTQLRPSRSAPDLYRNKPSAGASAPKPKTIKRATR